MPAEVERDVSAEPSDASTSQVSQEADGGTEQSTSEPWPPALSSSEPTASPMDVAAEQTILFEQPAQDRPFQDAPSRAASAVARGEPKYQPLTPDELAERLALNSSGLVEEIHALTLRQVQQEDARETRLDAKAGGLLGTAGLSLTVAFTFGGLLLQHPDYLLPLGPTLARVVLIAYVVALAAGLAAVIAAVWALFVNDDYESVSEDNVFNEGILDKIDRSAKDKEDGQRLYRRYVTVKHWAIYRAHFAIHQKKANKIRWGQGFFLSFLGILLLTGALLTYAAFEQYRGVETPKATAPAIDL